MRRNTDFQSVRPTDILSAVIISAVSAFCGSAECTSAERTGQEARVPRKLGSTPSCVLVGPFGSLLIFAHRRIDLFAPSIETTFEIE